MLAVDLNRKGHHSHALGLKCALKQRMPRIAQNKRIAGRFRPVFRGELDGSGVCSP